MSSIQIKFEWIETQPSPDDFARATMARLEIELDGRIITRVADGESVRDGVIVPLAPICEWLIAHWWFLLCEIDVQEASIERRATFDSRHDLSHAGDGFVLPKLQICSLGEDLLVRATRWRSSYADLEFLTENCEAVCNRATVEAELRELIDSVVRRLQSKRLRDTWLEREWKSINEVHDDEKEYCRAAALLGLDPYDTSDLLAQQIVELWNSTEKCVRTDLFSCADASSLGETAGWVRSSIEDVSGAQCGANWQGLRDLMVGKGSQSTPWGRGYELARFARAETGWDGESVEFPTEGEWSVTAATKKSSSPAIDGVVAPHGPAVVTRKKTELGCRFVQARAVGDYLGGREGASLLTAAQTTHQQFSRAFAAEFLVPSELLRHRLGGTGYVSSDTVDELAADFRVSRFIVEHQIRNHGLGTVSNW